MSTITISKIELPSECAKALDNLADAGAYGSTREAVVRHFVCSRLGVDPTIVAKKVSKKKASKKKVTKKS